MRVTLCLVSCSLGTVWVKMCSIVLTPYLGLLQCVRRERAWGTGRLCSSIVFHWCSAEFEAYKKEKALAAVNSRSGKKLAPQVSINQVTIRLLATVPSDLARHTICRAQERKVFVMLQLLSCRSGSLLQLPEEDYQSVIETLQKRIMPTIVNVQDLSLHT